MTVDELRSLTASSLGREDDFFWQHLTAIAEDYQRGVFSGVNDVVMRVGGKSPQNVAEYVKSNLDAFTS